MDYNQFTASEQQRHQNMRIEQEMEIARREVYRKSLDTIRVYNPLNKPFIFKQDGFRQFVPAKSQKDFPRYLAMHFYKKICDEIIGEMIMEMGNKQLKAMRETQMAQQVLTSKYEENVQVWDKVPSLRDPELLRKVRDQVIIGLVTKYGDEPIDEELPEREVVPPMDFRSIHDQLMDAIDERPMIQGKPVTQPTAMKKSLEKDATL